MGKNEILKLCDNDLIRYYKDTSENIDEWKDKILRLSVENAICCIEMKRRGIDIETAAPELYQDVSNLTKLVEYVRTQINLPEDIYDIVNNKVWDVILFVANGLAVWCGFRVTEKIYLKLKN